MNKLLPTLIFPWLLLGCPPPKPCDTCPLPANTDFPDAGDTRTACQKTCEHFRELKCEEGQPTKDGASCEAVCENMQTTGLLSFDLVCAQAVTSCAALETCPRK